MEIKGKNQTMEFFPSNTTLNSQGTKHVCCTSTRSPYLPFTPENPFTNYQTAIHPPLLYILANQTFRETLNKFRIGLFRESKYFSHELKYKQKQSRLKYHCCYSGSHFVISPSEPVEPRCKLKTILIYKLQTKSPLNFHQ